MYCVYNETGHTHIKYSIYGDHYGPNATPYESLRYQHHMLVTYKRSSATTGGNSN